VIIFDMSNTVAGAFCAKLLGMKGDLVTWVEDQKPGAEGRSPFNTTPALREYLRQNGNATEMDLVSEESLVRAVTGADVVITGWDGGEQIRGAGLDIHQLNSSAVEVAVSSFGVTGPYSRYRGGPIIDWAAGGYACVTGRPERHPLIGPKYACAYVTGYFASVADASQLGATAYWADDAVTMYLQAGTQWDALSHLFYGGQIYNGKSSSVIDESGAHSSGIDKLHDKFVGRGVLLDVARLHGLASPFEAAVGSPVNPLAIK
jgi:crotonobetainyl-CoA:carnitine CoA-transferase CaiB-like acyl-CoA transferase